MKGVPLRVEIGPKDIEKGQCVIARRDNGEKDLRPAGRAGGEGARAAEGSAHQPL